MKRIVHIVVIIIVAAALSSCSNIGNVRVLNYRIESITPSSLRSAVASVSLQISNKGPELNVEDLTGTLFAESGAVCRVKAGPATIAARKDEWIKVDCSIIIEDGVSLLDVLKLVRGGNLSSFSISYETTVKTGLISKKYSAEKVRLSDLMKK